MNSDVDRAIEEFVDWFAAIFCAAGIILMTPLWFPFYIKRKLK